MFKKIVRRIGSKLVVILIVGILTFFITHFIPGDPVQLILGEFGTAEQEASLNAQLGLDKPIYTQFINWSRGILRGDLGESIFLRVPVTEAIFSRIEPTFLLATMAIIIGVVFGIIFGVIAAFKHNTIIDQLFIGFSLLGISIPGFWMAFVLMLFFGVYLEVLPVYGYELVADVGLLKSLKYLILPALTLGIMQSGLIARTVRASMIDVLKNNYIRTARSKGLKETVVVLKHGLRNALMPTITVIGSSFGMLLGGTWIIETIFFIPGTGQLAMSAILKRDFPIIQGSMIFAATIYLMVNLLVDIAYIAIDPRLRD